MILSKASSQGVKRVDAGILARFQAFFYVSTPLTQAIPRHRCKKVGREFMVDYSKKHRLAVWLAGATLLTIVRIDVPFYSGYSGNFLYLILLCTEGIRYIFLAGCAIVIITSKLNPKSKLPISIPPIFLILITIIPTGLYRTAGALAAMHKANALEFRNGARVVLEQYDPLTCFSNVRHFLFYP